MAKQPQDYQSKKKARKKVDPHDPSEMFTYVTEFTKIEFELPFIENISTGDIRRASLRGGDDKVAFYFTLMEGILGDEFEDKIDSTINREISALIVAWEEQSASNVGESSSS